jgi:hypothetical protein
MGALLLSNFGTLLYSVFRHLDYVFEHHYRRRRSSFYSWTVG